MTSAPVDTHLPRSYRLTRPDGLGFFRRRSLSQFVLACVGLGLGLLALVVRVAGENGRLALGVAGGVLVGLAFAKAPSGEEATELVAPVARYLRLAALRRHRFAAVLSPVGGAVPPLFAGISLLDLDAVQAGAALGALRASPVDAAARERHVGLVVDRADGSVSVLLHVYGDGFLLLDDEERDGLVDRFGAALASVSRDDGVICRLSWSQFSGPAGSAEHRAYVEQTSRADPVEEMAASYGDLVDTVTAGARRNDVIVTLTARIGRSRRERGDALLVRRALELREEAARFSGELIAAGLSVAGPLPPGQLASCLRERLDPTCRARIERRGRTVGASTTAVALQNAFPLLVEERARQVRIDDSLHRLYRVAEWPKVALRADWLAGFLCEGSATRSFTVSFCPQPRGLARRQALAVATRVGASIDERETKGRRVGAEERRAMLAAEALDDELEAGAAMELLVGLVDVSAPDEDELARSCEEVVQAAASLGMELRRVDLRQGEALVCALPLGRLVQGRAR